MTSRLRIWLQLFRAPNLFTVPGDPIVGFMLANYGIPTGELFFMLGASLCFYCAGLLDNDLADLAEDRAERPSRPLPSGAANPLHVWIVAALLSLTGLALCWAVGLLPLKIGGAILISIAFYNHFSKRIAILGALNMGLCRSLSLLLGAAAAPSQTISSQTTTLAILIGLYIAAITNLARFETHKSSPLSAKWFPSLILGAIVLIPWQWQLMGVGLPAVIGTWTMRLLLGVALGASVAIARRLSSNKPSPIPPAIGQLIRLLLVLQAAFCAYTGLFGLIVAGLLLPLWPVSRAVSKRFYAS